MPKVPPSRDNWNEGSPEKQLEILPSGSPRSMDNWNEIKPQTPILETRSKTTYRDRVQKLKDERSDAFDKDNEKQIQKDLVGIAELQEQLSRGKTRFGPLGLTSIQDEINRRMSILGRGSLSGTGLDERNIDSIEDKIIDLKSRFSPLKMSDVVRDEGIHGFSAMLHIKQSADEAFEATIGIIPDKESKIRFYSDLLNLPEETVRDNFQLVEEKAIYLDHKKAMDNAPRLLQFVSDPRNMSRFKDSLKSLAWLESLLVSRYGSLWDKGKISIASVPTQLLSGLLNTEAALQALAGNIYRGGAYLAGGGDVDANDYARAFNSFANAGDDFERITLQSAKDAIESSVQLTEEVRGFERFSLDIAGGIVQVGGFIASGIVNPGLALYSMVALEGGHIYGDLRDKGVSQTRAFLPALGGGAIIGGIERLQIKSIVKLFGARKATRAGIGLVIKTAATQFLQEDAQNVVTEIALLAGESSISEIPGFEVTDRLKKAVSEGAYEGLVAAGTMVIIGVPTLYSGFKRYRKSVLGRAKFKESKEVVKETPVAQRSSKDFEEVLENITDNDEGEILASDVKKFLQELPPEKADILETEFLDKLDISREDYDRAVEEGLEVGFKMKKWIASIMESEMGEALEKDISWGDIFSEADTKLMRERIDEQIDAISTIFEELSTKDEIRPQEIDRLRTELMEIGGYRAEEADHMIDLFTRLGSTIARARNETLAEWAKKTNPVFVLNSAGSRLTTREEAFRTVAAPSTDIKVEQVAREVSDISKEDIPGLLQELKDKENQFLEDNFSGEDLVKAKKLNKKASSSRASEKSISALEDFLDEKLGEAKHDEFFEASINGIGESDLLSLQEAFRSSVNIEGDIDPGKLSSEEFDDITSNLVSEIRRGISNMSPVKDLDNLSFDQKLGFARVRQAFKTASEIGIGTDQLVEQALKDMSAEELEFATPLIKKITETKKFLQDKTPSRGMVEMLDGETVITKFKATGDNSTILHEMGHIFLQQMQDLVRAGEADANMLKVHNDLVTWAGGDIKKVDHFSDVKIIERIISGWEAYIAEGKAPATALVGAFRVFQKWFRGVYFGAKKILKEGEITDQVRESFDFWLASENEIEEAQAYYRMGEAVSDIFLEELAKDKKTKAARNKLADAKRKAAEEKEASIQKRKEELLSIWLKESGGREEIRKQADDQIRGQRAYKSIESLRKVGINPLVADLGESEIRLIGRTHGEDLINQDSTADLNKMAIRNNYVDEATMLGEIVGKPPVEVAIEDLFQRMMTVKMQEFRQKAEELEAVPSDKVIHNDTNLELMIADAALIREKIGKKQSRQIQKAEKRAVQDKALELLSTLRTVRDSQSYRKWSNREAKWAAKAFEAASKGDFKAALIAKNKQIHYFSVVQASFKIREQATKIDKFFNSKKVKDLKGVTEGHATTVNDIVSFWRLNKVNKVPKDAIPEELRLPETGLMRGKNNSDEGLASLLPQYQSVLPEWMLRKRKPDDYVNVKDLTFEQMQQLESSLKFLLDQGRGELKALKKIGFDKVQDFVKASVARMEAIPRDKLAADTRDKFGKFKKMGDEAIAWLTMPEFMLEQADGSPLLKGEELGPLHKLFHAMREKDAEFDVRMFEFQEGMKDMAVVYERARKETEKRMGGRKFQVEGLPVPEIFKRSDINQPSWDFYKILAIAWNMGNDANLRALQVSEYGFTDEQLEVVKGFFTAEVWETIQGMWKSINTLFPELMQAHRDTTFITLPKEAPKPLTVRTLDGKTLELPGGYFPLDYDTSISPLTPQNNDIRSPEDISRNESVIRTSSRPKAGATNARLRDEETGEALSKRAPLLDVRVLHSHLKDTIRYITHARIMQEVDMITRDPLWRQTFIDKFGRDSWVQLRKSLNYIARPERKVDGIANRILSWTTKLFTVDILGFKFMTGVKQRLSEINAVHAMNKASGTKTGLKYLMVGHQTVGWKSNAIGRQTQETIDFVHKRSMIVKARALGNFDRDIRDFLSGMKPFKGTIEVGGHRISYKDIQDLAFWWVRANDAAAVYPVWRGAHTQALAEHLNGIKESMGQQEADELASQYADTILSTSQPGSLPSDLSSIQRSEGAIRMLTVAMTWSLKAGNRTMWFVRAWKRGEIPFSEVAKHWAFEWWLPALAQLAAPAIIYTDKDKPEWHDFFLNPAYDSIGWIPFVSHTANSIRFGPSEFPALRGFKETGRVFKDLSNAEFEKAIYDALKATAWWAGLPLDNIPADFKKYRRRITGDR